MAVSEAIFAGANAQPSVSDLDPQAKEIAFGAGNNIAFWQPLCPASKGIHTTLKSHTDSVLNVKFLTLAKQQQKLLVSTSADKTIKVWKYSTEAGKYQLFQDLANYHAGSITCLSISNNHKVVVTSSADGLINIWNVNVNTLKLEKIHQLAVSVGFYALALAVYEVAENKYVLFIGGTKPSLFVYSFATAGETEEENTETKIVDFKQAAVLAGHENWVKSIVIKQQADGEFLIASGSLDRYIRLWKLALNNKAVDDDFENDKQKLKLSLLSNKKYKFSIDDNTSNQLKCAINFEALILGHDDWISSLQWSPNSEKLQLLSASADTSIMIWQPDEISGVWVTTTRLGELSIKGASTATGASGGFWSSIWYSDDVSEKEYIFTHGKTGSWRVWSSKDEGQTWDPEVSITGPFKEVTDVAWSRNQDYLLATSLDQTTRLFSQWVYNNNGSVREDISWKEFARPQIHGYDMVCVSSLSDSRFVSGGDEKVMRLFDEPKSISKILQKFSGIKPSKDENAMPEAASLPTLGLSNKAEQEQPQSDDVKGGTEANNNNDEGEEKNISFEILAQLTHPPLEDHLQRHTLWPELEKLYGHGYELTTIDTSFDGKFIVSCCKSNSVRHAVLRIFDTESWLEVKPSLQYHELTVTRVRFSKDNKYILSVSRDRKVAVWSQKQDGSGYELAASNNKAHTRIVWDGDWAPQDVGYVFVTASRDKSIKIWKLNEQESGEGEKTADFTAIEQVKFKEPVTSVSVYGKSITKKAGTTSDAKTILIGIGLEGGDIIAYLYNLSTKEGQVLEHFSTDITPSGRINRLSWNSVVEDRFLLAAGSADHSVRIYSLDSEEARNKL